MHPRIALRAERPADAPAIADLVRRAYAAVPYSDHREHRMIARLRESDGYLSDLALLAEIDGAPVGHILLTRAWIVSATAPRVATLALAPLSVVPEHQRQGVGTRLVDGAIAAAACHGHRSIVLVGEPDYFPRFGFRPLADYPITLPFDAPDRNRMILPLAPGALDGVAGQVEYARGWLDH